MRLVNLTPHVINIIGPDGNPLISIPPSGDVIRVEIQSEELPPLEGIPIVRAGIIRLVDPLPAPQADTIYIVSTLVAQEAAKLGRYDFFAPDTGPESVVRDENGRIIGVRRLQTFAGV